MKKKRGKPQSKHTCAKKKECTSRQTRVNYEEPSLQNTREREKGLHRDCWCTDCWRCASLLSPFSSHCQRAHSRLFFFSPFFFCLCAPAPFFLLLFLGFRAPSFKTGTLNPFKNARSPLLSNCFLYSLQINEVVLSFSYDPFFFLLLLLLHRLHSGSCKLPSVLQRG